MSMYDKNHYNIVISLKLIKINGETKQNKTKQKTKWLCHFALLPAMDENSFCSTFLAAITFTNVQVLTFLIGVQHFIVSEFAISCWHMRLSIFAHIPNNCHLYAFFFVGDVNLNLLTYQKKWVILLLLSFMNSLQILETSPLSDIHFAEIFSQPVSCHFTLLTLALIEQKNLTLMKVYLTAFFSRRVLLLSYLVITKSQVMYMYSFCIFQESLLLHFTFRPMSHFDLTFVKGVMSVSIFFSLSSYDHDYILSFCDLVCSVTRLIKFDFYFW